ncbi:hypothetical protein RDI58_006810 [Solanum bulbocastanum]|uniref:Uncharacterized protein n=1 Tax=Solanum bulbocastanum TaxID=147425 RepID=A0AAN8TYS7_SOLBU
MDGSDLARLAESMAEFVEAKTKLTVGPIHRPPMISKKQMAVIIAAGLVLSPFLVKRVLSGDTLLHDKHVWMAGSIFVYFFSVSGAMHNIIRKMPMFMMDREDPGKLVFFYQGSGMQLGAEGFAVGFLYTIVGLLLAFMTNVLVRLKSRTVQRVVMLFALFVSFWAVKKDLLETRENGEDIVAINGTKEVDHHDKIVKSINLIEESKDIISRENLLEFEENGEAYVDAINAKKEEARHKIVNSVNLFEESKDEEEEEELNKSNIKNLPERPENDEGLLSNQVSANCSEYLSNLQKHNGEEEVEVDEVSNSSVSSYISYPQNHRYHCCRNSNDEFEDIDLEDEANNNEDGNEMILEESSYDSLFSLSIDDSTRNGNNPISEIMCDKEVNSPLKPMLLRRFKNVDRLVSDPQEVVHFQHGYDYSFEDSEQHRLPVLNPIRNPCLLKDTGITTPPSLLNQQEKENIDMNLLDFCTTYNRAKDEPSLKHQENEIAVDASLSSWLVECSQDDTPNSKNSVGSVGNSPSEKRVGLIDRPISGALTVEELKDEKPIVIGTIGSYLRHSGQASSISSY